LTIANGKNSVPAKPAGLSARDAQAGPYPSTLGNALGEEYQVSPYAKLPDSLFWCDCPACSMQGQHLKSASELVFRQSENWLKCC